MSYKDDKITIERLREIRAALRDPDFKEVHRRYFQPVLEEYEKLIAENMRLEAENKKLKAENLQWEAQYQDDRERGYK